MTLLKVYRGSAMSVSLPEMATPGAVRAELALWG